MTTPNYVLLQRFTVSASASSVTFSNIPQTGYTDLKIVASTRSANASAVDAVYGRFNSTSTGYTNKVLYGETTGTGSFSPVSAGTYAHLGYGVGANGTANTFSNLEFYIPNYTSSNYKSVSVDSVTETNASTYQSGVQSLEAALWSNTAAITSITLTQESGGNFVAGSSFSLYGIADVNTTPAVLPKASGGDIVTNDGTYWYHAFLSSGVFVPSTNLTADCLVVAGGGGGGTGYYSGGGGAGGLLALSSQQVLSQTKYTVSVGAGGAAATQGGNSQLGGLTAAVGGGRGTNYQEGVGGNGGSGGGSGGGSQLQSTPTSGQGNAGGKGDPVGGSNVGAGGGGGGAGGTGGNGSNLTGGNGGAGSSTYSSWASVTGTGSNSAGTYYFAGGGGGGAGTGNAGNDTNGKGSNGGGNGGGHTNGAYGPTAGATNSGGGGGGASESGGSVGTGGAGGSGIVIIRYAMA